MYVGMEKGVGRGALHGEPRPLAALLLRTTDLEVPMEQAFRFSKPTLQSPSLASCGLPRGGCRLSHAL